MVRQQSVHDLPLQLGAVLVQVVNDDDLLALLVGGGAGDDVDDVLLLLLTLLSLIRDQTDQSTITHHQVIAARINIRLGDESSSWRVVTCR